MISRTADPGHSPIFVIPNHFFPPFVIPNRAFPFVIPNRAGGGFDITLRFTYRNIYSFRATAPSS
jgi:hypothetical protein